MFFGEQILIGFLVAFLGGKLVASAGDAEAAQEGFLWLGLIRQGQVQHAPAPTGGAGGLFALRVTRRGPLEA